MSFFLSEKRCSGIQGLSRIVLSFYSQFNPQQHHHQQQQNMFIIKINGIFFTSFFLFFFFCTKQQKNSRILIMNLGAHTKKKRLSIFLVHVTCFYVLEPMKPKISLRNQTSLFPSLLLLCQCTRIGNVDGRDTSTQAQTHTSASAVYHNDIYHKIARALLITIDYFDVIDNVYTIIFLFLCVESNTTKMKIQQFYAICCHWIKLWTFGFAMTNRQKKNVHCLIMVRNVSYLLDLQMTLYEFYTFIESASVRR